jgi:ABC-2 type transport system permease protein
VRNAFVLARKEFTCFCRSWTGVLVFVIFYILSGAFFSLLVTSYARISMESARQGMQVVEGLGLTRFVFSTLFLNLSVVLFFLVPAMTMRSFAEERKLQTLELLYTYPFSDFEILWGKFLGLVWIFEALFLPTIGYLVIIRWLGGEFDWGPVLTAYLGFWLLGNAFLALGLFVSSLTESQVISAVVTFAFLILFWIMDWVALVTEEPWSTFFKMLSPLGHYREFTLGIVDLSHVVYFIFFHFYFLFLTLRSIETRNWKA